MTTTNPGVTEYIQPTYSTETNAAVAGGIQGMLGDNGYLNSVMGNWYNQAPTQGPLGALAQSYANQVPTDWQNGAAVGTATGPGGANFSSSAQGQFNLGDTSYNQNNASPFIGNTTYDPNTTNGFLNGYVNNVVNEQARLSNQNLFENILPQVNSTFTGAGQFGSTRNADFTNRAIRDQQYTLAGTQGKTLMDAQNAAEALNKDWTQMGVNALNSGNQNYADWTRMGLNAADLAQDNYGNWTQMDINAANSGVTNAQNWAKIGNESATVTNNGNAQQNNANLNWAQLLQNAGQQDFNNWLTRANYPVGALGTLASGASAIESSNPLATVTGSPDPKSLEQWMTAMAAVNNGANSGSFDWLADIWG